MRAKLELIDGSLVAGDLRSPRLPLQTGYATLDLDFSHIQRVDRRADGGYDLRMRNGDRLTGTSGIAEIAILSLLGELTVPMKHIVSMQILPPRNAALTNLIAHYPLDGDARDVSGNSHDGAMHQATVVADRHGNARGALSFTHREARVKVPDSAHFQPLHITIAAWLRSSARSPHKGAVMKTSNANWADGYGIGCFGDSAQSGLYVTAYTSFKAEAPLAVNEWIHVAGTFDGKRIAYYQNGQFVSEFAHNAPIQYRDCPLLIGSAGSGYPWNGEIDEVYIFDRALTPVEISDLASQ
jgi:hypothetical protein